MSARQLFILGTGSQAPSRERSHHSCFCRWDQEGFIFDPGEGTQRQMIRVGVAASDISKIFITHFHGDHCLGLAGLIQRIALDRVSHPIEIFYPASGEEYLHNLLHASIFYNQVDVRRTPVFKDGTIAETGLLRFEAYSLEHGPETFGYRIIEKDSRTMEADKLAALGIQGARIGELKDAGVIQANGRTIRVEEVSSLRKGQVLAFIMDTRECANTFTLAREADLAICEATYLSSEAELAGSYGHLTAAQAATIAKEAGVRQLVLSHFSSRYLSTDGFIQEAGAIHHNVVVARDCMVLDIARPLRGE